MIKNITKIELKGSNFEDSTILEVFDPKEGKKEKYVKAALVYGRNGTGKSTIAQAFRKLSGDLGITKSITAELYDNDNQKITLSEDEQKHIFVFDEEYVDKNVKFQEDHLDTIIMLGEAADLTQKLDQINREIIEVNEELKKQEEILSEFRDAENVKSPKYYQRRIYEALRGDDNWAGRDREINDSRQNTGIRDNKYKEFLDLKPQYTKTELIAEYKTKIQELQDARKGKSVIEKEVPKVPVKWGNVNEDEIVEMLNLKIDSPEFSAREKRLLSLIEEGRTGELTQRLHDLKNDGMAECPYCFQPITQEYRKTLVDSLEKVLSEIVKEHQEILKSKMLNEIFIDLNLYKNLEGYEKCEQDIIILNNIIIQYNDKLRDKISNPYEPITIKKLGLKTTLENFYAHLSDLENARKKFNYATKQTRPLIQNLRRINAEIAYYDVKDFANQMEIQLDQEQKVESLVKKATDKLVEKNTTKDKLEGQRNNTLIAIDEINSYLKYIFFSEDRLQIHYDKGVYKLMSRGKDVKPCDISVGERNIIGLSYYFTDILKKKEEAKAYEEEYFLVIDDPISSYDVENRIGILSFLKYKLELFLESNENTKALILTHDLQTCYDINKILTEILEECNKKRKNTCKFNMLELRDNRLSKFIFNSRQEYTELLKMIYNYASDLDDQHELLMGNIMRQVLEAFSTFEYKKGIEAVSTDEVILNLLQEKEYVSYFKNLMYRLVLHGGSHREEAVKTMSDYNFFSIISSAEKKRTAKDILCFIYLLNQQHLLQHLKGCKDVEQNLKSWCNNIKRRAAKV